VWLFKKEQHCSSGTEFTKKFGWDKPYCLRFVDVAMLYF